MGRSFTSWQLFPIEVAAHASIKWAGTWKPVTRQDSDPCVGHPGCVSSLTPRSSHREFLLSDFFLYCTDTPFSMTVVLSAVCLSVLAGLLLSCACTTISVQNSFIPHRRDTGVSSCSKQAFEHTPMPLWGISSKLILPNSLHGSSFGVHFWSDVFLNPWLRVEGDPLLTAELQCPMTSLFLKLGLGLFTSAVYLIQVWDTATPQKIYISICIIWVSNSSLNPNTTCA